MRERRIQCERRARDQATHAVRNHEHVRMLLRFDVLEQRASEIEQIAAPIEGKEHGSKARDLEHQFQLEIARQHDAGREHSARSRRRQFEQPAVRDRCWM